MGCDGGEASISIPGSGVALLQVPDLAVMEEMGEAQMGCSRCNSEAPTNRAVSENAYRMKVQAALRELEVLRSLGPYLGYAPWLMEIHRDAYRTVDRWIRLAERRRGPGQAVCGTDIRASLPFDPNQIAWDRWFAEAWTGRTSPPTAASGAALRASRRVHWLDWPPDRTVPAARKAGAEPDDLDPPGLSFPPPPGLGRPHHPPLPPVSGREDLDCERFVRKFSLRRAAEAVSIEDTEASVNAAASSSLIGQVVESPGLLVAGDQDDRFNRPILRLLCDYLQDYYLRLEELATEVPYDSPEFRVAAAGLSGVFPFEPSASDGFARRAWTGYPSAPGGPAPQPGVPQLVFPEDPDILNSASNGSRWLRIFDHVFVLTRVDPAAGGTGHNGAVDGAEGPVRGAAEADTIGLAVRLLERSLPRLRSWEEPITNATGARFDWPLSIPVGADMVSAMEAWYRPGSPYTLQILLRDDAIFNHDAGGLGWAPGATVVLSRTRTSSSGPVASTEFSKARQALEALRKQAVDQFLSAGGGGASEPSQIHRKEVKEIVERLTALSQLLLHESGHLLSSSQFAAPTGISGDWYDGPGYRDFDAITEYLLTPGSSVVDLAYFDQTTFSMTVDADLLAYLAMLAVMLPWAVTPFYPLLAAAPPIIANHYVLTLYAKWWECLIRQNRGPLNDLQNAACGCDGDFGAIDSALPFPQERAKSFFHHWGWRTWYPEGTRPCDDVPLPQGDEPAPERHNCMCDQFNCNCGTAPGDPVVRAWC